MPAKQTSSVAFGGADWSDLFITSADQHFPSPLMPPNYDSKSGFIGGRLYRVRAGIQGKPAIQSKRANHRVDHSRILSSYIYRAIAIINLDIELIM